MPKMRHWTGFDRDSIVVMLRSHVEAEGTQLALAQKIGISASWLCDILCGARAPAGKVLDYLGLERKAVKMYVPKGSQP